MKKFIIFSTQRSGSAFLVTSLASHPEIECFREIFLRRNKHKNSYQSYRSASLLRRISNITNRNSLVADYLSSIFSVNGKVTATGFKLMYSQARRYPEVVNWLTEQNVNVIHLIRENFLRTITSREIAQARGIHHADKSLEKVQINLKPETLIPEMRRMKRDIEQNRSLFSKNPYMDVGYEAFALNRDEESKRILEFLDIHTFTKLTSELVKLNPHPLEELIENYNEVSNILQASEFKHFLD